MAGYSGTPLPKKLGIREGSRVALSGAPPGFEHTLGALPAGAALRDGLRGEADVVLLFADRHADLERRFPKAEAVLETAGGLWVCWPKQSSGVPTDLTEGRVREIGLASGLVDNKICAVDDTWSGLRFVVRVADRATRRRRGGTSARAARPGA